MNETSYCLTSTKTEFSNYRNLGLFFYHSFPQEKQSLWIYLKIMSPATGNTIRYELSWLLLLVFIRCILPGIIRCYLSAHDAKISSGKLGCNGAFVFLIHMTLLLQHPISQFISKYIQTSPEKAYEINMQTHLKMTEKKKLRFACWPVW